MPRTHIEAAYEAESCLALQGFPFDYPNLGNLVEQVVKQRIPGLDDSAALDAGVWLHSTSDEGYDVGRALFPPDMLAFLKDVYPDEYHKHVAVGASAEDRKAGEAKILDAAVAALDRPLDSGSTSGGALGILRNGFTCAPARFGGLLSSRPQMPYSEHTKRSWERHKSVRVRVMQQVHYSTRMKNGKRAKDSIDLVFFVNGIPVATSELKTETTQSVDDAILQYKKDRPVTGEPLLGRHRAVVHFAASNDAIFMTTHLQGQNTVFLPFNKGVVGKDGRILAGVYNPSAPNNDSATSYLWREILERDSFLDILSNFAYVKTERGVDSAGRAHTKRTIVFPRYHQLDVVRKSLDDTRKNGVGGKFLIQHSAGSGKTNEIAWLAHLLSKQIDPATGKPIFDKTIVVTDREVLDRQLQEAIKQLERHYGYVLTIDKATLRENKTSGKSTLLARQLTSSAGHRIIVTTMQTFLPTLTKLDEIEVDGKSQSQGNFAVIADEAHQSQSGGSALALRRALSPDERARLKEIETEADDGETTASDLMASLSTTTKGGSKLSFFAFTATPRAKTLQMFGRKDEKGRYVPFHVYSMQQAIQEGFILDPLKNYTTFETSLRIRQNAEGPEGEAEDFIVDRDKALSKVHNWARGHEDTIAARSLIVLDHFIEKGMRRLDGKGKVMIVTASRIAAVRYKLAMDAEIARRVLSINTVVAFSGEVEDGDETYTENSMNKSRTDAAVLAKNDDVRIIIVAEKLQTGYDEPRLIGMYVDKRLHGIKAVQTLSRLNRTCPGKNSVYVLDFANDQEGILEDFKQYQDEAWLQKETDPNAVYLLQAMIDDLELYSPDQMDNLIKVINSNSTNSQLNGALHPIKLRVFEERQRADWAGDTQRLGELDDFVPLMRRFCTLYEFMSHVVKYDKGLANRHRAYKLLSVYVGSESTELAALDTSQLVLDDIQHFETGTHDISISAKTGTGEITTGHVTGSRSNERVMILVSKIIEIFNELYGINVPEPVAESWVYGVLAQLMEDDQLTSQARGNDQAQFLGSKKLQRGVIKSIISHKTEQDELSSIINDKTGALDAVTKLIGEILYTQHNADNEDSVEQ